VKFKLKISIIALSLFFISVNSLWSQQLIKNIGLRSDISFFNYTYDFSSLPDVPRPPIPLTILNNKPVIGIGGILSLNISDNFFISSSLLYSKPELDFQDVEKVIVIIQGEPIEADILHDLETDFNNLEFSIGFGYNFFEAFNLTLGLGLNIPIKTYFKQSQKIISPENLDFIYPIGNHEGKISSVNGLIYAPNVTLSLGENILSIGKIGFSPGICFKFTTNSILSSDTWKFSSLSAGINLVFINKTEQNIRIDTILTRDTLTNFNSQIVNEITILKSTSILYDTLLSDNNIVYIINIKETYERFIPKPLPILNGELRTVFVSDDGTESIAKEIEYIKNIYHLHYFDKKGKKEKLAIKIDTVSSLNIPFIRFYPSAFSEAGLKEWQIKISSDNKVFKTYIGYDTISNIIEWYPFENEDIIEFNNITFQYEFILKDYEEQELVASIGEINFIKSRNGEKINNYTLLAIEPSIINNYNFRKLFSKLKKQKKVVLYHPFLSGIEEIIKPDAIIDVNEEILRVISPINQDNNLIIIGLI